MASSRYRWLMTPTGQDPVYVTPLHSMKDIQGKLVEEEQFLRYTWEPSLKFLRADYTVINDSDFDTNFALQLEEYIEEEEAYVPIIQYEFAKTDCEINEDRETVIVKPEIIDEYKKIIDNWDRQYDVIRSNPGTQSVKLKVDPIFQFYFPGSEYVTNSLRSTYWEQRVQNVVYDENTLVNDYKFKKVRDCIYAPGAEAGLSPDVSGLYEKTSNFFTNGIYTFRILFADVEVSVYSSVIADIDFQSIWEDTSGNEFQYIGRENNKLYFLRLTPIIETPEGTTLSHVSGATNTTTINFYATRKRVNPDVWGRYYIYNGSSIVYLGDMNKSFFASKFSNIDLVSLLRDQAFYPAYRMGLVFTSISTGDKIKAFYIQQYARVATPLESISFIGIPQATYELTNDILPLNKNYNRVTPFNGYVYFSDGNNVADQGYGQFAADATNFANLYFTKPPDPGGFIEGVFPVHQSDWLEYSMWFIKNSTDNFVQTNNSSDLTLKDAYASSDILSYLLSQIDPNITHSATIECSDFFYNLSGNIIRGNYRPVWITPKSNLINGNYDSPARKGDLSIGELLRMYRNVYKCYWYIENSKLKIEHISFFKKGKTYLTTPVTSVDLTVQTHPQNELPYSFSTKHYTFLKQEIPKLITFAWMDEVSEFFQGYDIELISNYVDDDNIQNIRIDKFTTDVSYILINSESINTDGFVLLETMLDINGDQRVPYVNINLLDNMYELQNGYLSFLYLHSTVWMHDLPAKTAIVNKEEVEAISIKSTKLQKPFKHPDIEIDDLQLVNTSLGVGKIYSRKRNLKFKTQEIELIYEPE